MRSLLTLIILLSMSQLLPATAEESGGDSSVLFPFVMFYTGNVMGELEPCG